MEEKRGHSHTINNLHCECETGGVAERSGKQRESQERQSERMRRCLFYTRRFIDKMLENLGEIPEKKYGIHPITMLCYIMIKSD